MFIAAADDDSNASEAELVGIIKLTVRVLFCPFFSVLNSTKNIQMVKYGKTTLCLLEL